MTGYLRRVISRSSGPPVGAVQPALPRRWSNAAAAEPFGIAWPEPAGTAAAAPEAVPVDTAMRTRPAGRPSSPGTGTPAPGERPIEPSPIPVTSHLRRDDRASATGNLSAPEPTARPQPHKQPRAPQLTPPANAGTTSDHVRATAEPRTEHASPTAPEAPTERDPVVVTAATPAASRAGPVDQQNLPSELPVRQSETPRVIEAAQARSAMVALTPPAQSPTVPAARTQVVIGRITVVVDTPRPVEPAPKPTRPRTQTAAVRPVEVGAAFAHRFGIGQL